MKILIITVIALVVPAFFLFVFVMGTYGRLSTLRRRCQEMAPPGDAAVADGQSIATKTYLEAIARYEAARSAFPANLVAILFGFGPIDHRVATASRPGTHGALK